MPTTGPRHHQPVRRARRRYRQDHRRLLPRQTGKAFLTFLRRAVKPDVGKEIRVLLDNLSTYDTSETQAWLARNPNVIFHVTPISPSWLNQIETWLGIATKQAIRRGTFAFVTALTSRIRACAENQNADAEPFIWTATATGILAKVRWVDANVQPHIANNSNNANRITGH